MSTVFDFADPSSVTLFFKAAGGLLLNVYSLTLGITFDKGLVAFLFALKRETNSLNIVWQCIERPSNVSLNGLMILPSLIRFESAFRSSTNFFCSADENAGWWVLAELFVDWRLKLFNDSQHLGFWLFNNLLFILLAIETFCSSDVFIILILSSWPWSRDIKENFMLPRWTTNFPPIKALWKSELGSGRQAISFRKTGIHQA